MKRRCMFLLIFVIFLFGFSKPLPSLNVRIEFENDKIAIISNSLASLTNKLLPIDEENAIFSPLSLYFCLSLMAETLDEATVLELLDFLEVGSILDMRNINSAIMDAYIDNSLAKEFKFKNFLFRDRQIQQQNLYNEELIGELKTIYKISDHVIDLQKDGLNEIIKAVNEATNNFLKITNDGNSKYYHSESANVLLNVLYFYDHWNEKFKRSEVGEMNFINSQNELVKTNALLGKREGLYYIDDDLGFAVGTLAFNKGAKMYFILPHEQKSLEEIIASDIITDLVMGNLELVDAQINYRIPKFDINYKFEITNALKNLGLTSIFSEQKSSPFYYGSNYFYDEIYQQSRVLLDEDGVKAAAATMSVGCAAKAPISLEVSLFLERPFLYLIMAPQKIILFSGIVNQF